MNKKKKMIILMIVLILLFASERGLSAYNTSQEKKEAKESEESIIYVTKLDGVDQYSYTDGTDTMSFTKTNGEWVCDNEEEVPMNQDTVQAAADYLSTLTAVRELTDPDDLADYGMDKPQYVFTFTDSDGNEHTLNIGNAASANYYAMIDDNSSVYTISSDFQGYLVYDLASLVQNDTVPTLASTNLTKVVVSQGGESTTFEDDETAMGELAGGFGALELTDPVVFSATDKDLEKYGLTETDRMTVTCDYKDNDDGTNKQFTIYIGSTDDSGNNQYVMVKDSKLIYSVSSSIVNNMTTVEETVEDSAE